MVALLGLASPGCSSGGSSSSCIAGYENCVCTADRVCLSGLTCNANNLCANSAVGTGGTGGSAGAGASAGGTSGSTTGGSGSGGAAGAGGGGSIDAAACISCWQTGCPTEVAACEAQPLCGQALTCLEQCLADDPEQCANCSAEGDAAAETAFFAVSLCIDAECGAVCSDGSSGDECSEGDLPRGSCVTGDGEICLGGEWQPEDCTGCALLTPAACGHVRAMALDPNAAWAALRGGVGSLIHTSSSVEATFNFTAADQMGIIQFRFTAPLPARAVNVIRTPTTNVNITLENDNGSSGCVYSLDATGDAYQGVGDGCWQDGGEFYSFIPNVAPGSAASLINIRLISSGPGIETLTIEGVVMTLF